MNELELNIKQMTAHFERLVRTQLARANQMEARQNHAVPEKNQKIIGICPGDGIGPIISRGAVQILEILLRNEIASGDVVLKKIEGLTLENRIAQGRSMPDDVLEQIKSCDVLLKGPTTTPQAGSGIENLESANVTLRRELDLYANVRPVTNPDLGIDWAFFRENTEGEYVLGSQGVSLGDTLCFDFKVTTQAGTRRIAKAAFDYARKNGKTRVSIVTKANIMKKTDGMFLKICHEVAQDYPEISVDEWYIDIMTANLINPALQSGFQVVLLPNLYGDILTDEAAQLQGGVGTAGSANMGSRYAMFEAIHGSAPRMVAEGLADYANPASIFRAVQMMLVHLGYAEQAKRLDTALSTAQHNPDYQVTGTPDGVTCQQYTEYILELLD